MNQALSILTPKQKFRLLMVKFLQKTKLNRAAHYAYYRYIHSFDTASQELIPALRKSLEKLIESDFSREGDYYEFGVFKGYAFWYAQHIAGQLGLHHMRFFGFDSFTGLPETLFLDSRVVEFEDGVY
jgi:O-methyltransferase